MIDYNYDDLSEADPHEQQIIWEHKYLGLIPQDEDDIMFLEEYLNKYER
ncbi:immunity protein YezG family protein [Peribacillus cavernae]|nr:immunity protein YezG family protein [Peribacillus cavernae]